jgi:hypothetical protein
MSIRRGGRKERATQRRHHICETEDQSSIREADDINPLVLPAVGSAGQTAHCSGAVK